MTNKSLIVLLVGIHFLIASFGHTILGKNAEKDERTKIQMKAINRNATSWQKSHK